MHMYGSVSAVHLKLPQHCCQLYFNLGFPGGSVVKNLPVSARDVGSIPGWERSPEKEIAVHSRVLAWEIAMDKEAWWATVHRITKK